MRQTRRTLSRQTLCTSFDSNPLTAARPMKIQARLVQLIYCSRRRPALPASALSDILAVSQSNNGLNGITGFLGYTSSRFLQLIEGEAHKVNELYARVMRDDRHTDLTLIDYGSIDARHFPTWSMGCAELDDSLLAAVTPGIIDSRASRHLDLETLSHQSAFYLLRHLSASIDERRHLERLQELHQRPLVFHG